MIEMAAAEQVTAQLIEDELATKRRTAGHLATEFDALALRALDGHEPSIDARARLRAQMTDLDGEMATLASALPLARERETRVQDQRAIVGALTDVLATEDARLIALFNRKAAKAEVDAEDLRAVRQQQERCNALRRSLYLATNAPEFAGGADLFADLFGVWRERERKNRAAFQIARLEKPVLRPCAWDAKVERLRALMRVLG
jgi:hypothetical protein